MSNDWKSLDRSQVIPMSRFTEEEIQFSLKQGDVGQPGADVCLQMEISEATFWSCGKNVTRTWGSLRCAS